MPKISIITTTYKHEEFISETIESILAQDFTDWELLIGDDSPDDATWIIIQNYVHRYPNKIKAWHHIPNKGIVDNMNFLLLKSSNQSEYIAFLEGDDLYDINCLNIRMNIFNQLDVDFVINNYTCVNEIGIDINDPFNNIYQKLYVEGVNKVNLNDILYSMKTPVHSFGSIILKRDLIMNILPFSNLLKSEKMFVTFDLFLWCNLFPGRNVFYTKNKLLKYRIHKSNSSLANSGINDNLHRKEVYKYFFEKGLLTSDQIKYYLLLFDSMILSKNSNKFKALSSLLLSFQIDLFGNLDYKLAIMARVFNIHGIVKFIILKLKKGKF